MKKTSGTLLKAPKAEFTLTLPVSDYEFQELLAATQRFNKRGIFGERTGERIKAFLLLLRYSGVRIRDGVMLRKSSLRDGRLLLYSGKTGEPVHLPLPAFVAGAVAKFGIGEYFFWSGVGNPKSAVADWQRSLTRLGKIAGVRFHSHMLRDSFGMSLLSKGVPLESVAALLGNSVKVCERRYSPFVKMRRAAA